MLNVHYSAGKLMPYGGQWSVIPQTSLEVLQQGLKIDV